MLFLLKINNLRVKNVKIRLKVVMYLALQIIGFNLVKSLESSDPQLPEVNVVPES